MSNANLSGFVLFRQDENYAPLESEFEVKGISDLFPELRFPETGVTYFYGNNQKAYAAIYEYAVKANSKVHSVKFHVDIGKQHRQKVDLTDAEDSGLNHTRFLDVTRAKKDVLDTLSGIYLKQLCATKTEVNDWPRTSTDRPYVLDAVHFAEQFNHLTVIAYSVNTLNYGIVKVATLFDATKALTIDGGPRMSGVRLMI